MWRREVDARPPLTAIVAVRARSFGTEVPQDDAAYLDSSKLTHCWAGVIALDIKSKKVDDQC